MRCVYCRSKAGFLKRTCPDCVKFVEAVNQLPGSFGFRELLDVLFATGASDEKIRLFIDTDVDGTGSLRDHLTARMTNEVMAGLGQPSHLKADDIKKVKKEMTEGTAPSKVDQEVVSYNQLKNKG
ncbi:MAG: hypothetical protein HYW02_08475 [Deltaproteobacteria bacterium]|nr:hypothetical protein [Deltaproteobacteria bacterium]MBI2501471.1 hypothetical protein [Deltaproteobacteria bacterium]